MERCTTCQFYDRQRRGSESTANAGQCRRQAPALSPLNQKSYMIEGVWPTVRDDDWCGEWKALVRRVDPSRISDVLNTPLSSPLPPGAPRLTPRAASLVVGDRLDGDPPRLTPTPARAASASLGKEPLPAGMPLPPSFAGGRRGDD